jgi:phosphoglycolate phosphatase
MHYKTICLDYDGTIHDSIKIYYKAFLKAYDYLVETGYQPIRDWSKDEVKLFLGQNPKEMWESFKPSIPEDVIAVASKMIGEDMTNSIKNGEASLFDGALETLQYLKDKGYYLIYLSNSKNYYMEMNKKAFNLDLYFDEFIVSEMYNYVPKKEILASIKNRLPQPILMVGDRIHDMESGIHNKIDTVACLYGYGKPHEFEGTTYQIEDIKELTKIL